VQRGHHSQLNISCPRFFSARCEQIVHHRRMPEFAFMTLFLHTDTRSRAIAPAV
jgi:hypothetical protein